jgi:hypothetical protein
MGDLGTPITVLFLQTQVKTLLNLLDEAFLANIKPCALISRYNCILTDNRFFCRFAKTTTCGNVCRFRLTSTPHPPSE